MTQLSSITAGIGNLLVNKVLEVFVSEAGLRIEAQKNSQLLGKCTISLDGDTLTAESVLEEDLRLGPRDAIVEVEEDRFLDIYETRVLLGPGSENGQIRLLCKVLS